MELVHKTAHGRIIHGDNLDVLHKLPQNSADSCISDFPYGIDFMGKRWDTGRNFYSWCRERALALIRVMKPGGYAAIFGHPKTNHRMKCAFEDSGFKIVEEIDWIFCTGFPKNQDISKLLAKSGCASPSLIARWSGWKTAGLKPAHETITIFQKPMQDTYINNLKEYGCGGMNIDACRTSMTDQDREIINAKASKNPTANYASSGSRVYGKYAVDVAQPANEKGRFPMNVAFSEEAAVLFDACTEDSHSRMFPVFKYHRKVAPRERKLPNSAPNPHVTLKPVDLIKWLIQLLTPLNGFTLDITAGSCTHGVACEMLNRSGEYCLSWLNIELQNTNEEPYCNIGQLRVSEAAER